MKIPLNHEWIDVVIPLSTFKGNVNRYQIHFKEPFDFLIPHFVCNATEFSVDIKEYSKDELYLLLGAKVSNFWFRVLEPHCYVELSEEEYVTLCLKH